MQLLYHMCFQCHNFNLRHHFKHLGWFHIYPAYKYIFFGNKSALPFIRWLMFILLDHLRLNHHHQHTLYARPKTSVYFLAHSQERIFVRTPFRDAHCLRENKRAHHGSSFPFLRVLLRHIGGTLALSTLSKCFYCPVVVWRLDDAMVCAVRKLVDLCSIVSHRKYILRSVCVCVSVAIAILDIYYYTIVK